MSLWDFRQHIEQAIPLWALFVPVAVSLLAWAGLEIYERWKR